VAHEEGERRRIVSIRGVDRRLYEEIAVLARETGRTIGEVLNEAMRMFLAASGRIADISRAFAEGVKEGSEGAVEIGSLDEIEISRRDLEAVEKPVVLRNIRRVVIADDVPYELFESKVRGVIMVDELVVPRSYPKLLVARKCRYVKKIVTS